MSLSNQELIVAARHLLERADPKTAGLWPRASALLARQALEGALDRLWAQRAPGLEHCSARAQLICLPSYLRSNEELAERVSYTWTALSHACHHHAYEMPPTSTELAAWIDTVERFIAEVHAASRMA